MEDDNINIFNVNQLFNLSLVGKSFKANYTERCYVNESLKYRDKLIIDLPNELFSSMKKPLLESLRKNNVQHSCMIWKRNKIELLVTYPSMKSYAFGEGEWKIKQTYVTEGEICFVVERLSSSAGRNSAFPLPDTNAIKHPFNIQDLLSSCKEMFRMVTIILIVVVNFVAMLLEFAYKVLLLIPTLIESLMPLFLSIVDGITKCVGGFYLLLVALRNGPQQPQPVGNNQFKYLPIDSGRQARNRAKFNYLENIR